MENYNITSEEIINKKNTQVRKNQNIYLNSCIEHETVVMDY